MNQTQTSALVPSSSLAVLEEDDAPDLVLSDEAEQIVAEEAEREGISRERALLRLLL